MSFLFLSKLLPLFIYPLGLACLLLLLALILAWKNPRCLSLPVGLSLAILLLASNSWLANFLTQSLEWRHIPDGDLPNAAAIVLLGGGTKSAISPRPMVDLSEQGDRVIYAARLYQEGKAPLIIASGGRIAWKGGGSPESDDMAQLLILMGVPARAIIQEPDSLNTYENAVNVGKILQNRGIKQVLLVTSALHMPRALLVFQKQGIEAIAAPTDFLVTEQEMAELNNSSEGFLLNLIPDVENMWKTTRALKEYIGIIIYRFQGWIEL